MELREVSLEERPPLSTLSADERRVARSLTSRSLEPGSEAEVASGGLLPLGSR
jgi:hypothetical protein